MDEIFESIIEKASFKNSDYFRKLLKDNIKCFDEESSLLYFGLVGFLQSSSGFTNGCQKSKKCEAGVIALMAICQELGFDIEDEECFILFHLRNLGKFKIKESVLRQELKTLAKEYPQYIMEDRELTYALKNLRKMNFITYRKSTIQLSNGLTVRYRK
jgi:hypothetical protein